MTENNFLYLVILHQLYSLFSTLFVNVCKRFGIKKGLYQIQ